MQQWTSLHPGCAINLHNMRHGNPIQTHCSRCNATVLELNVSIRFTPPFSLISRILKKVRQEKVEQIIIVKLTWQTQPWYPVLLEISMQCPLLMTPLPDLLLDRQETKHPLVQNGKLMLVACLP